MKTQLDLYIENGFLIEYPMVFIKSVTRHAALQFYASNIPVLVTNGIKCYEIKKGTVVQDWEGILFVSSINK